MDRKALESLQVVVPNLHWRYSGVTATNRMMAPRVAKLLRAAWLGRDRPDGIEALSLSDMLHLRVARRAKCIWHARRNNEMIAGLLLKRLGWPFALVFTSAAQRHHTWITRFLIARMDAVIATSEAAAGYLGRPATVIPHGIDTDRYAPAPDRGAEWAAIGLPGRVAVGCFGRVRFQKGTDVFIEAMCRLLPQYPDFTAVVIGPLDERTFAWRLDKLVKAAGLSDRIRILGELPIDEVPRWYRRILIYAFTSRNEGFGLTLLEAMASGAAVVAARAGAAEKVVIDGETGILVPPGDVDVLAAALDSMMRDPARANEMGRKARERVLKEFSADAEAGKIAQVYRDVLRRSQ
jgi:mannosyltransferase